MFKWKYAPLGLSAISFALGFTSARPEVFAQGLTVGAILFCLFLILQFLEEESTLDEEQKRLSMQSKRKTFGPRELSSRKMSIGF